MTYYQKVILYCISGCLFLQTALFAEAQFYESSRPAGEIMAELIDQMGNAGMQYSVQKIYNSKTDGKSGLLLYFKASRSSCEIRFYEDEQIKNKSKLRVFATDANDAQKLHILLTQKMKMKLAHISDKQPTSNTWPVKVPVR